jgi:hypothetical protein
VRDKSRGDIGDIKALLQGRIRDLLATLVPDGALHHGYWFGRNPARSDNKPGSFWIICERPGKTPGAWRDEATGDKGDVIDLIAYVRNEDRAGALKWARAWLNYEDLPPAQVAAVRQRNDRQRQERERIAEKQLEENRRRAMAVYLESKKGDFATSIAARYLATRGIDLAKLDRMPGALGSLARGKHTETNSFWPVMCAGMTGSDGKIWAVHRTFLQLDGSGKAPVTPVRKIWPSFAGAAIHLWRGETNMRPKEAAKHGLLDTLVICEGVEDGLSIAMARPDLRIWAAGALGNVANVVLPDCSCTVIVAADNDWGKPQAEKQLDAALQAIARTGRKVFVARSPVGKDFNDCLMAQTGVAA